MKSIPQQQTILYQLRRNPQKNIWHMELDEETKMIDSWRKAYYFKERKNVR